MIRIESRTKLAVDILKNEFDELIEKKEVKVGDSDNFIKLMIAVVFFALFAAFSIDASVCKRILLFLLAGMPAFLILGCLYNIYFSSVKSFKKLIHKSFIVDDYDQNILDLYYVNKDQDCFDDWEGFGYNDYYKLIKYKNISKSSLDIIDNSELRDVVLGKFKHKIESGQNLTVDEVLEFLLK